MSTDPNRLYQEKTPVIVIAWEGLPTYAAHCIRQAIDDGVVLHSIIGTKPKVPMVGMEKIIGRPIVLVNWEDTPSWEALNMPVPDIFVRTGWKMPSFNCLSKEVRKQGGKVVCMMDTHWIGNLPQILRMIQMRFLWRQRFDMLWVPGASGKRLAKRFGVPESKTFQGLLGSDVSTFTCNTELTARKKQICFAGNLFTLKGLPELLKAFRILRHEYPEWELKIMGNGPLASEIKDEPGVQLCDFGPPQEVAKLMGESPIFILPSRHDAWGLVVHEAAAAGCYLIASDHVGAVPDLVGPENGSVFKAQDVTSMVEAITEGIKVTQDPDAARRVLESSQERASRFGPHRFSESLQMIVNTAR